MGYCGTKVKMSVEQKEKQETKNKKRKPEVGREAMLLRTLSSNIFYMHIFIHSDLILYDY